MPRGGGGLGRKGGIGQGENRADVLYTGSAFKRVKKEAKSIKHTQVVVVFLLSLLGQCTGFCILVEKQEAISPSCRLSVFTSAKRAS